MSNCTQCTCQTVNSVSLYSVRTQYVKLFRKLCPKKPINLQLCEQCYRDLIAELQIENESRQQHKILSQPIPCRKSIETSTRRYVEISETDPMFVEIQNKFAETLDYKIIRIEKSNNPILEQKFMETSKKLSCQNIKSLFHGSGDKAYDQILETGFDVNYAAPTGLLGQGIYFAESALYSHSYGRITKTNIGKINHLLYCKVNLGKTCIGHTGLISNPNGFDGVHSDYQTYCVFENFQGIPQYIIYYLVTS
jgi:hypothetical protein